MLNRTAPNHALVPTPDAQEVALVRALREKVGGGLAAWAADTDIALADREARAREMITAALNEHTRAAIAAGTPVLDTSAEAHVSEAVFNALFGLGGFQPLLDDPAIENIYANGNDVVFVDTVEEKSKRVGTVASSDDELVEMIRLVAARAGAEERRFDRGSPELNVELPDGSRMHAVMAISARPSVTIRRHRYSEVTLADLVRLGTVSPEVAAQLGAAVRARLNILVAGGTNAGKTTLLRALAAEIPSHERLVTIEDTFELGLHKDTEAHPNVVPLQARQANLEGVGAITQAMCVRMGLRMSPDRVIVGEVRGEEVVPMCAAMSQGNDGSMTTVHARSTGDVFTRLQTYAAQAPERLDMEATNMMVASAVQVIVHVAELASGVRVVTGIREVTGLDGATITSNEVYRPGPDKRAAYAYGWRTETIEALIDAGADPALFDQGWAA